MVGRKRGKNNDRKARRGREREGGGGMDVELMNKVGTDLDLDLRFYSEKAQVNHEHESFDSQNG